MFMLALQSYFELFFSFSMEASSQACCRGSKWGFEKTWSCVGQESLWRPVCAAEGCLSKGFDIWEKMLRSQKLIPILCIYKVSYILRLRKVFILY